MKVEIDKKNYKTRKLIQECCNSQQKEKQARIQKEIGYQKEIQKVESRGYKKITVLARKGAESESGACLIAGHFVMLSSC